jgi:TolA-binding protein
VVVYQAVESVQAEALYKAARCFEELGQAMHADRMRKSLLAKYPKSEWAEKTRAGA